MKLRGIIAEDFCNYKFPSMFLISTFCDFKCCKEQGLDKSICQNYNIASDPINYDDSYLYNMFSNNDITKAVVIGGLEPFFQFEELCHLISTFRDNGEECDFVIYTGYYPDEIENEIKTLSQYNNIIIKFGRYIPDIDGVYDEVLGVRLVSKNQYAERIS